MEDVSLIPHLFKLGQKVRIKGEKVIRRINGIYAPMDKKKAIYAGIDNEGALIYRITGSHGRFLETNLENYDTQNNDTK